MKILFKNYLFTSLEAHCNFSRKTKRLMFFGRIIAIYEYVIITQNIRLYVGKMQF
jgi:hypothetical protein